MNWWIAPSAALIAGALGGLLNTFMSDAGSIELPGPAEGEKGESVWRPGGLANVVIGAGAALVSWALYGQAAGKSILDAVPGDISWANFAAAVLVGMGGSRWLSAEVDKNVFKKTAVVAAQGQSDPDLAATISSGTPGEALRAAISSQVNAYPQG